MIAKISLVSLMKLIRKLGVKYSAKYLKYKYLAIIQIQFCSMYFNDYSNLAFEILLLIFYARSIDSLHLTNISISKVLSVRWRRRTFTAMLKSLLTGVVSMYSTELIVSGIIAFETTPKVTRRSVEHGTRALTALG